jgi:hypothetical protein
MNKIILSFFSLVTVGALWASDGIEITVDGGSDLSSGNGVHEVTTSESGETVVDFHVENNTGASADWKITRLRLNEPQGWSDYVCWGVAGTSGQCYLPSNNNPWNSPQAVTVNNGEAGTLAAHITPGSNETGMFRYYIVADGNYVDSVDVNISKTASIKSTPIAPSFTISPNPASEQVLINVQGAEKSTIKMIDLLGNVVYNEIVYANKGIDVTNFKNGVYFVIIESEGIKPSSKKLVVKH